MSAAPIQTTVFPPSIQGSAFPPPPQTTDLQLDLATPRSVVLQDRGRTYTLHCRRITEDDWTRYFMGIVIVSEQQGRERINTVDVNGARLALVGRVLTGAEGYRVEGGQELTTLDGWQNRVPLAHRLQLAATLTDARPSAEEGDGLIYLNGEEIVLTASWNLDGSMVQFGGLKHRLQAPTEAQYRRYASQASRSRVVGGSRTGKTIYSGAQLTLAELYDELVLSVDGYASNGLPLGNDQDRIRRSMDMLHKVMSAQELFQPQETAQLAAEDEEA